MCLVCALPVLPPVKAAVAVILSPAHKASVLAQPISMPRRESPAPKVSAAIFSKSGRSMNISAAEEDVPSIISAGSRMPTLKCQLGMPT